jgi:hypothetical protein
MKADLEIWKDIDGYEGLYQVSNRGRIKALNFARSGKEGIVKQQINHKGYNVVHLSRNDVRRKFVVHRLVALAFIPNVENKPCVDHINTIRNDNRVENLRWVTHKENCNNELTKEHMSGTKKRRKGYTSKKKGFVTSDELRVKISRSMGGRKILCLTTGEVFETASEASRKYNLTPTNVLKCCKGERKSAGKINEQKLIWQYYN